MNFFTNIFLTSIISGSLDAYVMLPHPFSLTNFLLRLFHLFSWVTQIHKKVIDFITLLLELSLLVEMSPLRNTFFFFKILSTLSYPLYRPLILPPFPSLHLLVVFHLKTYFLLLLFILFHSTMISLLLLLHPLSSSDPPNIPSL